MLPPVSVSCQVPHVDSGADDTRDKLAVRYPPTWLSMLSVLPSAPAASLTMCSSALSPAGMMITYVAHSAPVPGAGGVHDAGGGSPGGGTVSAPAR